ncbi:peptidase family M49-domain-containing protein [Pisolithus orientalis]|uniref:peptidase family M49-domain-containing protein n=1 Tax=Pisolithus orientalis TaxID=936130 RepID=UPI002223FFD9|nr:peptidase family M49-domain-containing protein [Pisolithus orientalis]KAI6035661.1 peptidase family M49-domain-containing protein [Pisolithus orientalis]
MASFLAERYLADKAPPICRVEVAKAFDQLTPREKLYAHYIGQACWAGGRVVQGQWTPQAHTLYDLLVLTFSANGKLADLEALKQRSGVSEQDFDDALQYSAQVLHNLVNYKSFGFTKFVPRVPVGEFAKIIAASTNAANAVPLWETLKDHIYSTTPESSLFIGKRSEGHISNYYLGEVITDEEVSVVQAAAEKIGVDVLNTRTDRGTLLFLSRLPASNLPTLHDVSIASGAGKLTIEYGDFSEPLSKVITALQEAKRYTANETQTKMLECYIKSFETGSIEEHKKGSAYWVKDLGPVVESYIGFIETYVDPYGGRAEWEGFTAIVNKEMSAKYDVLVDDAPELIKVLPWGKDFEVDVFRKPDFTALEIVQFATGGIPAGINNYYNIRESTGFKNVSLANILSAKAPNEVVTFIHPDDLDLYNAWDARAFELQVANHELLGHGSGKLFQEAADGTKNFDPEKVINPLTGKPIETWYKPGQTPDSVLGEVSSSMEECRAEAVALYLANHPTILKIFGYTDRKEIEDIVFITFLLMARAGLRGLEFYDPVTKKHGQAHMQARLGITNFMLNEGLVRLEEVRGSNGELENVYVRVDREKVLKEGQSIAGKLLLELQVRRSTADGPGARKFYTELTTPLPGWLGEIRNVVLKMKQPRKMMLQPNTFVVDGEVVLKEYPLTAGGMIESLIERNL